MKSNTIKALIILFLVCSTLVISHSTNIKRNSKILKSKRIKGFKDLVFSAFVSCNIFISGGLTNSNIKGILMRNAWRGIKFVFRHIRIRQTYIKKLMDDPVSYVTRLIYQSIANYGKNAPDQSITCSLSQTQNSPFVPATFDKYPVANVFVFVINEIKKNNKDLIKAFLRVLVKSLTPIGAIPLKSITKTEKQERDADDEIIAFEAETNEIIDKTLDGCFKQDQLQDINIKLLSFITNLSTQFQEYKRIYDEINNNLESENLLGSANSLLIIVISVVESIKNVYTIIKEGSSCFGDIYVKLAKQAKFNFWTVSGKIIDHSINFIPFWSETKGIAHLFFHIFGVMDMFVSITHWIEELKVDITAYSNTQQGKLNLIFNRLYFFHKTKI